MADQTYHFELNSQLLDPVEGDGKLELATGTADYGVPPQFGGQDGKTSPEELIMAALSACFSMTFGFICDKRKVGVSGVEMHAECQADRIKGKLQLTSITLKPHISVQENNEKTQQEVKKALERAEQLCLIANSIRGNVELNVEEEIV